jgi:hypothetical protein
MPRLQISVKNGNHHYDEYRTDAEAVAAQREFSAQLNKRYDAEDGLYITTKSGRISVNRFDVVSVVVISDRPVSSRNNPSMDEL